MRILIAANHYPVASGRYVRDALLRLGHEVRSAGPPKGAEIWGLSPPRRYIWEPNPESGFDPELLLAMDSDPAVLEEFRTYPARLRAVYGVDNHVRHYGRGYAHYFLAHRNGQAQPIQEGDSQVSWLPCGYDPAVFGPSEIPWRERTYDVACIGVMYPQRWAMITALKRAGLKVIAGAGLIFENMARAIQDARCSVCVSAFGDVAQRIFESMACDVVVITDPLRDLPNSGGVLTGVDSLPTFRSAEELVTLVLAILASEEAAQEIRDAALSAAPTHTWDQRAKEIIAWASLKTPTSTSAAAK